jgi:hypothetical protein
MKIIQKLEKCSPLNMRQGSIPDIRDFGSEYVTGQRKKRKGVHTGRYEYVKLLISSSMQQIACHTSFIFIYD